MTHGPHAIGHDGRCCYRGRVGGVNTQAANADVADRHFRQAKEDASGKRQAVDIDVLDKNAVDIGRSLDDRCRCTRLDPVVMAVGIAEIMDVGRKRHQDAVHLHPAHGDIADTAATTAARLDPQAAIGADHVTILDGHIMNAAGHFRTNDDAAMAAFHQAMADFDAAGFAQVVRFALVAALAGLDGDAIVADGKAHTLDRYIAAAFGVEAVGIGAVMGRLDVECHRRQSVAALRVDGP
ncbi:hypothetical protein D3C71_1369950 [compost metagenome]